MESAKVNKEEAQIIFECLTDYVEECYNGDWWYLSNSLRTLYFDFIQQVLQTDELEILKKRGVNLSDVQKLIEIFDC